MTMEVSWLWLLLLPLAAWVWVLARRSYAHLSSPARWSSAGVRMLILVLLLAALARPTWLRSTDGQHLIFLIDASRSITPENIQAALDEVDRLAAEALARNRSHRLSVIAFGRHPRLLVTESRDWSGWPEEQRQLLLYQSVLPELYTRRAELITRDAPETERDDLQARIIALEEFRDKTAGDHTDLLSAIRLALNTGRIGEARALFLLTDANFNRTDWQDAFDSIAAAGHPVHTIALDRPIPPEVAATDLSLPQTVRMNQGFTADLRIASTVDTSASIVVFKSGYASAEFTRQLRPGQNIISIPGLYFRDKGFHTVDVVVRAEQDTRVENNTIRAIVNVPGELRVLYVDSDESQQSYLTSALALEGIQVEARPAAGVPLSLTDLLGFDAFILSNVPADRLSMRQMQMIRTYVQDFGGGFIMLGGDQSFGLGGYFNTPVEEVLPVRMPIQKELNRPSLAIMLVIDKSGSMSGVKMQLAKRAAMATADAINPRDQIGVIGFDSAARTILELTPASDRATISDQIASLDAGGGTFIYPALESAHEQLQLSSARRKHIILLSDGVTQGFGYPELAQMMAADGITISAVGIGEDADMRLMDAIAAAGGGRSYFTNDFYSIPQIFTREALRASRSMLIERLILPSIMEDDEAIAELDYDELPPLSGYVATTPREAAKVIIISDAGDPILAKWRTGLGRAAAFTSDTKPRWAEDWIRWPDFPKFWAQLVRSVAGQDVDRDLSIQTRHEPHKDGARIIADVRDAAGAFLGSITPELTLHDPQTGARRLPVQRDGPGLFSAQIPQIAYGRPQQLAWHVPAPSSPGATSTDVMTFPFGLVYSFSPEFRTLGVDETTLEKIHERTGGRVTRVGGTDLALDHRRGRDSIPLWPALLAAAIVLAPLDILIRRLG